MKKILVASILGVALNVASSYGQGYIVMQNYDLVNGTTPVYAGITYGAGFGAKTGEFVGSEMSVDLLYSLTGQYGSYSLVAGSQTGMYASSTDGGSPTTDGAGVFIGPTVVLPGYTAGDTAYFIVQAFNGSSPFAPNSTLYTQSLPFAITGIQTSNELPAGDLLDLGGNDARPSGTTIEGLQPFAFIQPEPSEFALAGLGAAALMLIRRRVASK